MLPTITVAYIVRGKPESIRESYKSTSLIADEYIYVVDNSTDKEVLDTISELECGDDRIKIVVKKYENELAQKQYLLKQCTKEYILLLDGDEVLSDNAILLRQAPQSFPEAEAFSLPMHFHTLALSYEVDNQSSSNSIRFIKNKQEIMFQMGDRLVLTGYVEPVVQISDVSIHNYTFTSVLNKVLQIYLDTMQSTPGSFEAIKSWYKNFLTGNVLVKGFNMEDHPQSVKDKFRFGEVR